MNRCYLSAFASVLGLALSIGAASAADLSRPPPTRAPAFVPPYYNWTGFYAGINGGAGWGTSDWSPLPGSFKTSGGLVGGTLGYNWQFGQWVWGLEGDADWSDIKGSTTGRGCGIGSCTTQNDFLATVRGRLGFAADRWMPYVTGGLAIGDIKASNPIALGVNQTNAGWTAGGGIEFALASNWTAKVEYLYVDLGNVNCTVTCGRLTNNVSFTANVVRGGFNYRF